MFNPSGTRSVAGKHEYWLRRLRLGLGVLWLIDALLQMQPGMFHPAFYGNLPDTLMPSVLQDLHESAPSWIAWAVRATQWCFIHFPIQTNLLVIVIQLFLAACLLLKLPERFIKIAAWLSIFWGMIIWVFGEALGGLGSWGDMTFYAGFPGSALLYAFAGFVLLGLLARGHARDLWKRTKWSIVGYLVICGILQLLPINGQWDVKSQMSLFGNSGFQAQPGIFSAPVMAYTLWVSGHASENNIVLALLVFLAAYSVWFWQQEKFARGFVYVWLLLTWWFSMDFGNLFSGLSTDPNIPPILFLLLLAFAPRKGQRPTINNQNNKLYQ